MLRSTTRALSPELQRLVGEILNEETRQLMRERRDSTRQAITRRVTIAPNGGSSIRVKAFSRDISNMGIGLIGEVPWSVGQVARLEIDRLESRSSIVLAECRWSQEFADGWYLSGWNFMNVVQM